MVVVEVVVWVTRRNISTKSDFLKIVWKLESKTKSKERKMPRPRSLTEDPFDEDGIKCTVNVNYADVY